ncbi:MAG TPA: hypothetical protein VK752_30155 [Bryobacteraceae bacterium]|jgi:hypothetical protein|nr:hypothetical protein [Bryobacteraceae bacterium]
MSTPHRTEINRAEINRANAQHSTGPKTQAGKRRSSQNALRHGLTSQVVVMPAEDPRAYQLHLKSFIGEYHPTGPTETHLVQALADTSWRRNRIVALETNLVSQGDIHGLATLSLYSQRLSREFERTRTELCKIQKTRRAQDDKALDDFLDIREMYEGKGEVYDPSEDGFVFSRSQINEAILRRNREREADNAWEYHNE